MLSKGNVVTIAEIASVLDVLADGVHGAQVALGQKTGDDENVAFASDADTAPVEKTAVVLV